MILSKLPRRRESTGEPMPRTESEATGSEKTDVSLAAAGDPRAFERLYRSHEARIFTLARRMAGTDDAPELTQEIFVRAWEKLSSFRGESAFGTWLYRLGINLILTRRESRAIWRKRHSEDETVFETLPSRPASPDHRMDFESALERLPKGARQILVLHDVEGYKHEEIAGLLGVTSGTSKAQLFRARMLMRAALDS
jgi:RNA polymerase sigma factor (sigma-70 family)